MTRIRLTPYLEQCRDWLGGNLRAHPDVDRAAGLLTEFFDELARTVPEPEEAMSADVRAERSRNIQLRRQVSEAIRSGFVGTLRAIRPPALLDPPGHGGSGGPDRDDDRHRSPIAAFQQAVFGRPEPPVEPVAPSAQARVEINVSQLLASLAGSLQAADRALAAAEPPPAERVPIPWTEDGELMELFQDLLRALITDDKDLALRHIERLARWLPERHGVEVLQAYDGNDDHFRVMSTSDPSITKALTLRPALVRADTGLVVLRGEVMLPAGFAEVTPAAYSETTGAEADHE